MTIDISPLSIPHHEGYKPETADSPRAGIIGTGFMGRVQARAVRLAGAAITGVAGSRPEKPQQDGLGPAKVFASADQLTESGEIDPAHICTPHHLHALSALNALSAGLAVICEKPLATDAEIAALMAGRAAEAELVAAVLPVGARAGSRTLIRDPETLSQAALSSCPLPAGHPEGYHDCFDAFAADTSTALRGEHRDGLPVFADVARAAAICEAVLASAQTERWTKC
ncbi:Gfo/Idh/MocA family protein [Nonomuraea sp. H19]|uniref:Gfo/Idh/MocA family protein n=1 Tax=Nonomuraea sp. H19 TaxID=3452206 RepID=UPI003F8B8C25